MLTLDQLQKFCAKNDPIGRITNHLRPFRYRGYVYATDGRICIRIQDDGSLLVENTGNEINYSKVFEVEENCDIQIPPLPDRIDCQYCCGTALEHDCLECDGDGMIGGEDGIVCHECAGSGEVSPAPDAQPCWHCNGRGEKEFNPVKVGDTHFNRIYLALAAEMPGAHFVHVNGYEVAKIKFDGGEIAVMPTRVQP